MHIFHPFLCCLYLSNFCLFFSDICLKSTMAKLLYQTLVLSLVVGCIAAACVCQKQSFRMNYTIASGILFPVVVRKCERYLDGDGIFERGNILDLPTVEPPCCCKSQWRYRVGCYYTIIDFLLILLTVPRRCFFCGSLMLFLSCFVLLSCTSVCCCLVVTCLERADLLALVCDV